MKRDGKKLIIPIFVPHAGCPHDCCFCNQKTISGQLVVPSYSDVVHTLESYIDIADNYASTEVAFYGGSFTGIPLELQRVFLKAARPYVESGKIDSIRLSTRPDCINDEILDFLKENHVSVIELGAQSMDPEVLVKSVRGHSPQDTVIASGLIKEKGFSLGLQTMTGLPGADKCSDEDTCGKIIALKPDIVRIYPTIVIKNTALAKMYYDKEYTPPTLDATVELCASLVARYEAAGITVIRLGLQSTDNIGGPDSEIAAGPYHPSFGQLVRSRMALEKMMYACKEPDAPGNNFVKIEGDILQVFVPFGQVSTYIGQKKINIDILKEMYGFTRIIVREIVEKDMK